MTAAATDSRTVGLAVLGAARVALKETLPAVDAVYIALPTEVVSMLVGALGVGRARRRRRGGDDGDGG